MEFTNSSTFDFKGSVRKQEKNNRQAEIDNAKAQNAEFLIFNRMDEVEMYHVPTGSNIIAQVDEEKRRADPKMARDLNQQLHTQLVEAITVAAREQEA